jgi:hypothetical protein
MFIEVVIDGSIERRVHVNLHPFTRFTEMDFSAREELIRAYITELKLLYQKADFQLAFESRMNLDIYF